MKHPLHYFLSTIFLFLLIGCGASEDAEVSSAIDPLTQIDTTRPLITLEEIRKQDSIRLVPFRVDSLWGFADTSGVMRIEAVYQSVQPFRDGLSIVRKDSLFGLIDKLGKEIVPPAFLAIHTSSCGIITLRTPQGYALLGLNGKRLTSEMYSAVYPDACGQGRIPVIKDKKVAFLDLKGKNITGFQFEEVFPFSNGLAPAKRNGKWGMIGLDGKDRVNFQFESLFPMHGGNAVGMEKDKTGLERWGVIDSTGKIVVPFQFGRITGSFQGNHIAAAARDPFALFKAGIHDTLNTWFIFDRKGNLTGETHAHPWDDFSEGLVVAERDGKFGYIDSTGNAVIPYRYDWACAFRNGLAWVGQGDRYGFIDKKGKVKIPLKYAPVLDYVYMEQEGALVADPKTKQQFYVDKHGKEFRQKP